MISISEKNGPLEICRLTEGHMKNLIVKTLD